MEWLVKDRALVLVASARALALRTAQCIALCCAGCPGPVLRRKCDKWCPTTGVLTGFYRIDLNAPVDIWGKTWGQWISEHDAHLGPCAIIRFGTSPENCYVLDRNCSRCFWPAGCNYNLNYAGLPVATFQNPIVAECRDCVQCEQCCESATILDCFGLSTCRECGSSYRTSYQYNGYTSHYIRGAGNSMILFREVTVDHTIDSLNDCIAVNDQCNSSTIQRTIEGNRHVRINQLTQSVPFPAYTVYEASRTESIGSPSNCSHAASVFAALSLLEVDATGWNGNTSEASVAGAKNTAVMTGTNGLLTLIAAAVLNGRCTGFHEIHFGGPFSGLWLNDVRWTWSVTLGAGGATVNLTYSAQNYTIPASTRILNTDINTTAQFTFQISKLNECAPNAPGGCRDLFAHAGGTHGTGNGSEFSGGLIG